MTTFDWPVFLKDKRFRGTYLRKVRIIEKFGDNTLFEIKTERGSIQLTLNEIKNIIKFYEKM